MKDAWQKLYNLRTTHTKEWRPRPDLKVIAFGTERYVELALGTPIDPPTGGKTTWRFEGTQRNVITMRELANVILEACDFVEKSNPKWARDSEVLRKLMQKPDETQNPS